MRIVLTLLISLLIWGIIEAQERSFELVVADSVGLEGAFQVEFRLKNARGDRFQAPDFDENFEQLGAPSQSYNTSYINGKVTRELIYTFRLQAKELGTFVIEPATIIVDEEVLESAWKKIVVAEGISNKNLSSRRSLFGNWGQLPRIKKPQRPNQTLPKEELPQKKKKKRKTYKM